MNDLAGRLTELFSDYAVKPNWVTVDARLFIHNDNGEFIEITGEESGWSRPELVVETMQPT